MAGLTDSLDTLGAPRERRGRGHERSPRRHARRHVPRRRRLLPAYARRDRPREAHRGNLPSGWELILVLLVIVLVFGAKRLPDSARSLGRSMRILKAETKGLRDDDAPETHTTAHVVQPVAGAAGAAARRPFPSPPLQAGGPAAAARASRPPPQPFVGQQLSDADGRPVLFDAQGRPVQVPVNGVAPDAAPAPHRQA